MGAILDMNTVMQFLQTTSGPLAFVFTVRSARSTPSYNRACRVAGHCWKKAVTKRNRLMQGTGPDLNETAITAAPMMNNSEANHG